MKKQVLLLLVSFVSVYTWAQTAIKSKDLPAVKKLAMARIDKQYDTYKQAALNIWKYSEVGYKEYKSTAQLQELLTKNGFTVEAGVAGIPTAFVATYGSGKPVIGILAEFDALPGLSQEAVPEKKADPSRAAGHACGHHLFGVASVAAAIEMKETMMQTGLKGTIKVYGTPAEEGGAGKVYMVREKFFDGVDVVMHWHPGNRNAANPSTSLANVSAKFRFHGTSAHAAGAPERGRSALDAVEAMNYMVNMMREHIPSDTRIHYIITAGGEAPNVVPDFAEVYYYARHPKRDVLAGIFDRIKKIADAAAMGTETRVEYEIIGGVYDLLPNEPLARLMHANLTTVGGVTYTPEELEFGKKIQQSLIGTSPALSTASTVDPFKTDAQGSGGSTDVGDVSYVVPTVGLVTATWVPGVPAHSWQAVACGGVDIGIKGMMVAAKTLALTGIDLLNDGTQIQKAKEDYQKRIGPDFKYSALIGDRKPALDYRDK
ncbi:MAG: amidohydrolase [Flammeovirgaceae bacterium]|nr:MAG: amidohydrolase [Flammeovirgaceae bacterium]